MNTENFDIKEALFKIIASNKGVSLQEMIEYLDYVNKISYSEEELEKYLNILIAENRVIKEKNTWLSKEVQGK